MRRIPLRLLATIGALWTILTITPLVSWWAQWLSVGFSNEPTPVLVVLAGDSFTDQTLGYSTYLRCVYAAAFWREYAPQRIIVSGGPAEHPISPVMADFLVSMAVPRERITLETRSNNTQQNIAETAILLNGSTEPITLLTSDFHMRRALLLARRAHLNPLPHPVPDAGKRFYANPWERSGIAVELSIETAKLLVESLRP